MSSDGSLIRDSRSGWLVGFGEVVRNLALLVLLNVEEHRAVLSERARGKKRVRGRKDKILARRCVRNLDEAGACWAQMLVVAAQQLQTQQFVVTGNQSLNLVEDCERIKWRELRFEVVRGQPNGVTISLAGLRSARLTNICAKAAAKRNERLHRMTHLVREPNDELEIAACTCLVGSLVHKLEIAVAVRYGTGLLVEHGGGKHDVGDRGSLSEEEVLHDEKGVLQRLRRDTVARDGIRTDNV